MGEERRSVQPGLFDRDIDYNQYSFINDPYQDRLIMGKADQLTTFIVETRRMGYDGDFSVWDYTTLLESYSSRDEALRGLRIDSGLEAKLFTDSTRRGNDDDTVEL